MSSEANLLDERGFSASLAERVGVLRPIVEALAKTPASAPARARVQRRLHALGAAARTVGFLRMAVRICDVQSVLEAAEVVTAAEIDALMSLMDGLPSLATKEALATAGLPRLSDTESIRVLVVGDLALEELLRPEKGSATTIATARFEDPSQVFAALRDVPDAFVVDADLPGARAFVAALIDDLRTELVPIMTIGRFETRHEIAHFVALGVTRTFTKPVGGAALRRACTDAIEQRRGHTIRIEMRAMTLPPPPVGRTAAAPASVPAARTQAPAPSAVRSPPPPGLFVGRRIVAADDDPAVAWFLSDLFRKMGCRTDEALDGKAAIARALDVDRTVPDLVVAALAMSDLDGAALVRALRADPATRDVPVLLQSWKEEDLEAARGAGIDAALVGKGASPEELVAVAGALLEPHARLRAKLRAGGSLAGTLAGARVTVLRLLAMAQEMPRGLKLTIKDATFCHELVVMGGALRSVTRHAEGGGEAVTGARAMATAIGTFSGSFAVETVRDTMSSPLGVGFVVDAIHAARALEGAASGAHLANVAELRFDADAARALGEMAPTRAAIAQRLVEGAAPRDLLSRGEEDPSELASVLGEMCRRGLVTAVREEAPPRDLEASSMMVTAASWEAFPPAPALPPEPTLPLLLRRQRAILSAPPPIVREASQPALPALTAAPLPMPIAVFVPTATEERPRAPVPATALAPTTPLPEITDVEATGYACPEPSISVPIVFEEPQFSRPIAPVAAVVAVTHPAPPAPPAPIALALSPALLSPPPTTALVVRQETPPPPAARWTLSPPPGPSSLSLPPPPAVPDALEMPMPTFYPRDEGAAPPLSVTTRPPAQTTKVRRPVAVAVLAVALLAGAGIRWTVAAPPARSAAASPRPSAVALPPQGLLEVAAADGTPIQIDGIPRGVGPKLSVSLSEGAHEVRTEGPNGKTRLVEVGRGRVTHIDLAWRPAPVPPTR